MTYNSNFIYNEITQISYKNHDNEVNKTLKLLTELIGLKLRLIKILNFE